MYKLFLLDAYALIYRSYYAFIKNPRINSKGMNTSAVMGFVNTLNEIMQKEQPTHIGVAFDHGKTFRDAAFAQYKAQREATPEDIRASVPVIKAILQAMHIPCLQADGFEADDVIGTLASKAGAEGIETYMLTPDKDYGQLVSPGVYIYRPRHGGGYEKLGPDEVTAKYGIASPSQVIDLLALMGDSADNFPGCPGVGEKTAARLIAQFGSVDAMLSRTAEIKGKLREKVEGAVDDIRMSQFLATIRRDVPIDLDLGALAVKAPDAQKLRQIFDDLEFRNLADKMLNKSENKPKQVNSQLDLFAENPTESQDFFENTSKNSVDTTTHSYQLVDNEQEMRRLVDILATSTQVAISIATTSAPAIDARLTCLSFATAPHKAFYVPVPDDCEKAQTIVNIFKPIYESTRVRKTGHDLKPLLEVLMRHGVSLCAPMFDTMLAHYVLHPEQKHDMGYLADALLSYRTMTAEAPARGRAQQAAQPLDAAEAAAACAERADMALQLCAVLEPQLHEAGAWRLFAETEMPLVPVLAEMESAGVRIDTQALADVSATLTGRMQKIEERIYQEAGERFNIASPKQVGDMLFGKMHIVDKPKKTKTGQYVTSEEVLMQLAHKSPVVADILEHRGLKKLLGTYVDALPRLINARTGHIHTTLNQAVTATGRLSSSDPNLQNIPVRGEDGKEIRRCFIPEEGQLFFSADYSQIELRVMAHLSGDDNLIEAFREGHDIHAATAAKIYHKPIGEVTRDERTKAKRANFGIIYGITVFGLAERLEIPRDEARQLIDGYFESFPKVKAYMEQAKQQARERGYAETMFGRRRYLPDINSGNATVRGFAERNAINAPIQGTAADIIKIAMVRINRQFHMKQLRSRMILQVHDELNFSVVPEERDTVEQIVLSEMQNACTLRVPLVADSGWGDNWLEAH